MRAQVDAREDVSTALRPNCVDERTAVERAEQRLGDRVLVHVRKAALAQQLLLESAKRCGRRAGLDAGFEDQG